MIEAAANEKEAVFLATTAVEECWNPAQPILFLGEWCLLYERASFWQTIDAEVLPSPYAGDDGAGHACYKHVIAVYERVLPVLASKLEEIHGVRHGERYWRIVLGPWLLFYLSVVYDKYRHLTHALDLRPELTTIVLDEQSFVVPNDTLDFANFLHNDVFNLQIYSKIFAALGKYFPSRKIANVSVNTGAGLSQPSRKQRLLIGVTRALLHWKRSSKHSIFLRSTYFSNFLEVLFLIKSKANVLPLKWPMDRHASSLLDNEMRGRLGDLELGNDKFERCLSMMLATDLPKCFVELFDNVGKDAGQTYPTCSGAIFSANNWYFDEMFKRWAAESSELGTWLLGTPHGGSYGGLLNMLSEDHETAIVDRYYSWGWERQDCYAKIIPLPASKLAGRKKIDADNSKNGVLWAGTITSRYLLQFPALPIQFSSYLDWQKRFVQTLTPQTFKHTRFRPHREDGGWGVISRLRDSCPNLEVETWDVPFQESLRSCRLYVCDHFSTTFAEALAANKPTILFWDPKANALRPEAQSFYDLLRAQGILFDTPEAAAVAVNRVYDDVEAWWNEPERQKALQLFCHQFARNTPDALALWQAEFAAVAAIPHAPATLAE